MPTPRPQVKNFNTLTYFSFLKIIQKMFQNKTSSHFYTSDQVANILEAEQAACSVVRSAVLFHFELDPSPTVPWVTR